MLQIAQRMTGDRASAENVVAAMRIRPGTVKAHLHRATQALRIDLGQDREGIR